MEGLRSRRMSLRAPVYMDVRCDLADGSTLRGKAINLGTEGIYIKSANPISVGENLEMEFLLPGTLNSLRLTGEVKWARDHDKKRDLGEELYAAGIKFENLEDPYRGMVRDYIFRMLTNEALLRDGGILRVLDDIRNLPPADRLKAYHILIKKGTGTIL